MHLLCPVVGTRKLIVAAATLARQQDLVRRILGMIRANRSRTSGFHHESSTAGDPGVSVGD